MAAPNWSRVNSLFHEALERPAGERARFVESAADGDATLATEVLSLLAAHEGAGDFIEQPAARTELLEDAAPVTRLVGRDVGHYRITRILGEGGMGVVYLADDLRLGRPVALKALPSRLTKDAGSRERLAREARAAAALAHPALALARALEAAHARGIIHRDLKPENVIRTPERQVKILDFGLARFADPTHGPMRLTVDGMVLGTPGYMSPEQIRSAPIDGRTDIFSLGVMMYEQLAGTNPFLGADAAATLAAILERDPPPIPPNPRDPDPALAARLEAVARRCLAKTPADRLPSATALVEALEQAVRGSRAIAGDDRPAQTSHGSRATAFWWWQFHQAAASVSYVALLAPLWLLHRQQPGRAGMLLCLVGLAAGLSATSLRLHLWFTARAYPAEWQTQHGLALRWMRISDSIFALTLLAAAGFAMMDGSELSELAILFVAAAVAVLISFTLIEPATRRAASS